MLRSISNHSVIINSMYNQPYTQNDVDEMEWEPVERTDHDTWKWDLVPVGELYNDIFVDYPVGRPMDQRVKAIINDYNSRIARGKDFNKGLHPTEQLLGDLALGLMDGGLILPESSQVIYDIKEHGHDVSQVDEWDRLTQEDFNNMIWVPYYFSPFGEWIWEPSNEDTNPYNYPEGRPMDKEVIDLINTYNRLTSKGMRIPDGTMIRMGELIGDPAHMAISKGLLLPDPSRVASYVGTS